MNQHFVWNRYCWIQIRNGSGFFKLRIHGLAMHYMQRFGTVIFNKDIEIVGLCWIMISLSDDTARLLLNVLRRGPRRVDVLNRHILQCRYIPATYI